MDHQEIKINPYTSYTLEELEVVKCKLQEEDESLSRILYVNQQYQNRIKEAMDQLEIMLNMNYKEQEKIWKNFKIIEKGQIYKTIRKPIMLFSHPYFRSVNGMAAPENDDAVTKRKRKDVDAYLQRARPWIQSEKSKLVAAVYENALQLEIHPLNNRLLYLKDKMKNAKSEEEELIIEQNIEEIKEKIAMLKKKSASLLYEELKKPIDWLNIASEHMNGTRSAEDCELMWRNYLNPHVNRDKFTADEDRKLVKLACSFKEKHWDMIAKKLGTNRTAIQCLERFQGHLRHCIIKKFWTPEEDEKLLAAVEKFRVGDHIPWHKVTYHMDGWTRSQIFSRWNRNIKPESRVKKWTTEEDAMLYAAYGKYGKSWKKIAEFIPGRTNYSCRERLTNCLIPSTIFGNWSLEDDRRLIKFYVQYGEGRWPKVAAKTLNRSSKSCSLRLSSMKCKQTDKFTKAVEKCRAGMKEEVFMPNYILPTKEFPAVRGRRDSLRNAAVETLKDALLKINENDNLCNEPVSLSNISAQTLKQLSQMLLSNQEYDSRRRSQNYGLLRSYIARTELARELHKERYNITSSSSSSDSETECVSDEERPLEDVELVNALLNDLFRTRAVAGIPNIKKTYWAQTSESYAEYEAVKHLIFMMNGAKNPLPETVIHCADVMKNVEKVLLSLVMPSYAENSIPVVPASYYTLFAQLIFVILQADLEATAKNQTSETTVAKFKVFASDSLDKISGNCPTCQNIEMMDQTIHATEQCSCAVLEKVRRHFILLRERFVSTFLWPSLLSAIPLSLPQLGKLIYPEAEKKMKWKREPKEESEDSLEEGSASKIFCNDMKDVKVKVECENNDQF